LNEDIPYLRHSINLRNPYVDPLSYLQVRFLKQLRQQSQIDGEGAHSETQGQGKDEPDLRNNLLDTVLMTINGVAEGLQNTG
jgi:phosphoenolpyruvate carboxylase